MQNIPAGLIPYNHELYLTGKYIAETRGGFRPDEVVKMKRGIQPIVYVDNENDMCSCNEDGSFINKKEIWLNDLFLRPKTVKKWHPVFKGTLYDTEEECVKRYKYSEPFLKAVEVEVNEE